MQVELRQRWFDPNGARRSPADNPHDVPSSWKDQLPSSAKVLEEPSKAKAKTE